MKTLALLAFFFSGAALAQVQLPDGYLNGSNGANGSITPVSVCPKNSGGKTDWAIFANDYLSFNQNSDACGGTPIGPWMSYQTGVGFLQIGGGGNGLLIGTSGTSLQLNVATQQTGTRAIEVQQASGGIALDLQTSGAQICLANGTDCFHDVAGTATFAGVNCGGSCAATNVTASNSVVGGTNGVFGNGAACSGGAAIAIQDNGGSGSDPNVFTCGTNANINHQISATGAGNIVLKPGSTGAVVPSVDETYSLGLSGSRWTNVHGNAITFYGAGVTYNNSDLVITGGAGAGHGVELEGQEADGATAIGVILNNGTHTLATAGARIVSIQNNGTEKAYHDLNGNLVLVSTVAPQISSSAAATFQIAQATTQQLTLGISSVPALGSTGGAALLQSQPGGNGSGASGAGAAGAINITSASGGNGGTTGIGGASGNITIQPSQGGAAGSSLGGNAGAGGVITITGGGGGAGSSAATAGGGGSVNIAGGQAGTNQGGGGQSAGAVTMTGGAATPASGTSPANTAGVANVTGGAGGAATTSAGGLATVGAAVTITGGVGGTGAASTNTAAVGGGINIVSGAGGINGGSGGAASGNIIIDTGTTTSGTPGTISIGAGATGAAANSITIGTTTTTKAVKIAGGSGAFVKQTAFSSSITATVSPVPTGAVCVCTDNTAVVAIKCSVSGTTLTATETSSSSDSFTVVCL